jgi:selenocysteine lyase/cysteine desulfurase
LLPERIMSDVLNRDLIEEEYGFLGDEIFLNVSLVVVPPRRVQEAYRGFMDDYVRNFGDDVVQRGWAIVNEARPKIAALVNARSPDEIAFVKNTCEGMSILADGCPLEAGDEVLIADQEHQSTLFPWINQRRRGVALRVTESADGDIPIERVLAGMNERTRVLAVSSAQFSTGFMSDLGALGAECRKRNILFAVDAIQTLGRIKLDVREAGIDWLTAGGNKGLLGTLGAGVVYCSDRIVRDIVPPYAAYQSTESHVAPPAVTTNFETLEWYPNARRFESGNLNYNGILAISRGVDLLLELGMDNIDAHIRLLETRLRDKIRSLPLKVVEPRDPKNRSGIVCVYYPPKFEEEVKAILAGYRIHATIRGGYIRFGIDFYNTPEQMDAAADALSLVARLGEKARPEKKARSEKKASPEKKEESGSDTLATVNRDKKPEVGIAENSGGTAASGKKRSSL